MLPHAESPTRPIRPRLLSQAHREISPQNPAARMPHMQVRTAHTQQMPTMRDATTSFCKAWSPMLSSSLVCETQKQYLHYGPPDRNVSTVSSHGSQNTCVPTRESPQRAAISSNSDPRLVYVSPVVFRLQVRVTWIASFTDRKIDSGRARETDISGLHGDHRSGHWSGDGGGGVV